MPDYLLTLQLRVWTDDPLPARLDEVATALAKDTYDEGRDDFTQELVSHAVEQALQRAVYRVLLNDRVAHATVREVVRTLGTRVVLPYRDATLVPMPEED